MGLLSRIEELEKELLELKELAKEEEEFPKNYDDYWYIDTTDDVCAENWHGFSFEITMLEIGNVFKTKEQAEFAVEKLKVEAELRKFGRPFKEDEYNYFMKINPSHNDIVIDSNDYHQTQGTIYFESTTIANEATDTVGADRIKKYIFGVEEQ